VAVTVAVTVTVTVAFSREGQRAGAESGAPSALWFARPRRNSAASKLRAPGEEGVRERPRASEARLPAQRRAGRGAGSEAGVPRRDKGASVLGRGGPGARGEHKGKLCLPSTQVHLCLLRSSSQRKVTEEPAGSPPSGVWSVGRAKFFPQDAGN
jgi:hypothetical protein